MRIYHIALFFLIFNLMGWMVGQIGIIPVTSGNIDDAFITSDQVEQRVQATQGNLDSAVSEDPTDILQSVVFLVRGVAGFIGAFLAVPIAVPIMMVQLGAPAIIGVVFGLILGFIYFIAVYQLWTQRGIKDDE